MNALSKTLIGIATAVAALLGGFFVITKTHAAYIYTLTLLFIPYFAYNTGIMDKGQVFWLAIISMAVVCFIYLASRFSVEK